MNCRIQVFLCVIFCSTVQTQDINTYSFASATSFYKKIDTKTGMSCLGYIYPDSTSICKAIGERWTLLVMDTKEEYDFVTEENRRLNKTDQDPVLIGGSTQSYGGISYSQYDTKYNSRGVHVFLTHQGGLFGAGTPHAISTALCEKELNIDFESKNSYYKKILREIGTKNFNLYHDEWVSTCKDIGEGWALSVMDTQEEFKFVREENSKLSKIDIDTFLIDGSTQSYGDISYSQYDTKHTSGAIDVLFTRRGQLFGAGISIIGAALCEKAKP